MAVTATAKRRLRPLRVKAAMGLLFVAAKLAPVKVSAAATRNDRRTGLLVVGSNLGDVACVMVKATQALANEVAPREDDDEDDEL